MATVEQASKAKKKQQTNFSHIKQVEQITAILKAFIHPFTAYKLCIHVVFRENIKEELWHLDTTAQEQGMPTQQ